MRLFCIRRRNTQRSEVFLSSEVAKLLSLGSLLSIRSGLLQDLLSISSGFTQNSLTIHSEFVQFAQGLLS